MKLSELLPDLFKLAGKSLIMDDYVLTPEMLKIPMIKEKLLQCEEFSEIEELIILDSPSALINAETGQVITSSDGDEKIKKIDTIPMIVQNNIKFKGKFYLYSFVLSPKLCDVKDWLTPVKDSITIGPTVLNNNFVPMTPVTFFIDAELMKENLSIKKECAIKEFSKKLLEALQNREEYSYKGKRQIIIRCIYDAKTQTSCGDSQYVTI